MLVQADEVENLMDLGQPAGGEKKKAAGRLSAAFSQGFFGGGNNGTGATNYGVDLNGPISVGSGGITVNGTGGASSGS